MAVTPRPTPIDKYALGRNSSITIWFDHTSAAGVVTPVAFEVCISEGSISLDTDTIEINSNCQNGWKVKLPGLKSGTASFTGYIASSVSKTPGPGMTENTGVATSMYDIMSYLGQTCYLYINTVQDPDASDANAEFPLVLIPPGSTAAGTEQKNGFFKTGSVTISPDDAVKVSMAVELSGAQHVTGFVAASTLFPAPV
jgi:hypothetical protein